MTDLAPSPLAEPFPDLPEVPGVAVRVACARYKEWGRADLTFVQLAPGTQVAGVTTRSLCPSPEVEWCRSALAGGRARALVVNAGNANAFTGGRGRDAVAAIVKGVSAHLGCDEREVFVASTGVIGVPLPIDRAEAGLASAMSAPAADWQQAALAIGTTDTFPKGAEVSICIGGVAVRLVGIVKGSGMIAPDMATMLAFVFTDAAIPADALQPMVAAASRTTFECITVDGDTSTSDTLLAFATGQAGHGRLSDEDRRIFAAALTDLCQRLAHLVVRDGEGARKFITIDVAGAVSDASARKIAKSIANSPLVKTAIAGADANWGRVVMAVGKAGEPADRDRLSIAFGGVVVARDGMVVADYDEAPVADHLAGDAVHIAVGLGLGDGFARVWTCDLTHGYIAINADYRS